MECQQPEPAKCPHCGDPTRDCELWSDADMGWICETTRDLMPDQDQFDDDGWDDQGDDDQEGR